MKRQRHLPRLLTLGLLVTAFGCPSEESQHAPEAPLVTVAHPDFKTVPPDDEVFTGRTVPINSVEIRARVTGYLYKVLFNDGDEVQPGTPLYEIDSRSYQAELDRAESHVAQAQARQKRLNDDFKRYSKLVGTGAVSREEYEKVAGDKGEADAALQAALANVEVYKLDVGFCHIASPIAGRVSNTQVDPGNLVKADTTLLTTIVSVDPMYATFDIDEGTMLRIQRQIREGKTASAKKDQSDLKGLQYFATQAVTSLLSPGPDAGVRELLALELFANEARAFDIPVYLGTSDEKGFPHKGTLNFIDNRVDPKTGTLRARATFPNPKVNAKGEEDPSGSRVLTPGLFVRIRVPVGEPYKALLVAERAFLSDQGQKFVWVIQDGKAVRRPVDVGPLKEGLRVVLPAVKREDGSVAKGLEPTDLVVVNGLQRVRAGQPVRHEKPVEMASMTAAAEAAAPKPAPKSEAADKPKH